MSSATVMKLMVLGLFSLFSETSGMRKIEAPRKGQYQGWVKDKSTFICLKKWRKSSRGVNPEELEQFCLADLSQILDAKTKGVKSSEYVMKASLSWSKCESKKKKYAMKLCNLKGKQDKRISYKARVHVPKSCFSISPTPFNLQKGSKIHMFRAAVTASKCNSIINRKAPGRGIFVPAPTPLPILPTTTQLPETVLESEVDESDVATSTEESEVTTSVEESEVTTSVKESDVDELSDELDPEDTGGNLMAEVGDTAAQEELDPYEKVDTESPNKDAEDSSDSSPRRGIVDLEAATWDAVFNFWKQMDAETAAQRNARARP